MHSIGEYNVSLLKCVEVGKKLLIINNYNKYIVNFSSERLHCFKKSRKCYVCSDEGTKLSLETDSKNLKNLEKASYHFNLYTDKNVLMTKDHILPKIKGGSDDLSNLQTCCIICNNLKGSYLMTKEQILHYKIIYDSLNENPKAFSMVRRMINNDFRESKGQFDQSLTLG